MLPSSLEMSMLALARIILFLAVSTVMCFGVRIRIIFITAEQCSDRGFFCSSPHQWDGSRCTPGWDGTQPGWLTPTDHGHTDIPYWMVPCSVYRAGGEGEKEWCSEDGDFLSKSLLWVMEPCFPGNGWTPACHGMCWMNFLFFICLCVAFVFSIKFPWFQATNFLTFTLAILSLGWMGYFLVSSSMWDVWKVKRLCLFLLRETNIFINLNKLLQPHLW